MARLRLLKLVMIGALLPTMACAQSANPKNAKHTVQPMIVPNFNQPDLTAANDGYRLTPEDLSLDCKRLTGKIQTGIIQLRAERADTKSSVVARSMQKAAAPFIAGSTRGVNPEGDQARALTQLKAYNGRLAAKNCAIFDLEAALQPGATDTPRPIPKPKAARTPPGAAAPAAAPPAAKTP